MNDDFEDPYNPRRRAWRRIWLKVKCLTVGLVLLSVAVWMFGVPHLQGNFKTTHAYRDGFTPAHAKLSANYLGPTGWRTIYASDADYRGLPVVLMIPFDEVFRLDWDFPFLHAQNN